MIQVPSKIEIVEFPQCISIYPKGLCFEMDLLLQIIRILPIENVKCIDLKITATNYAMRNVKESVSVSYYIPVTFEQYLKDKLLKVEKINDALEKAVQYERIIMQYALVTRDAVFFDTLWKNYNYVSGVYIFEFHNNETMTVGPFKLIDFVRNINASCSDSKNN